MVAQRQDLLTALIACADAPLRAKARRFVSGLSADELQFIAEFLGACILESARRRCTRAELVYRITRFQQARPIADPDHKMILLLEYLAKIGVQQPPAPLQASPAN